MKSKLLLSVALGLGMFLAVFGCNLSEFENGPAADSSSQSDTEHDNSSHAHGEGDHTGKTELGKMTEALANFSEEDRQSAMKQHFCPVSDEMLGTMGEPEKVELKDQQVWICCDGCRGKLFADPDKYLAKLND